MKVKLVPYSENIIQESDKTQDKDYNKGAHVTAVENVTAGV